MSLCKFSAWLLLLLMALNCKITTEKYLDGTCLLRICTGNFSLFPRSHPHGSTLDVLLNEVEAVEAVVRLMPRTASRFYCTISDSLKYREAIKCNCSLENNTLCRVTRITLSKQGLVGRLPATIGNLTYLSKLDLSGNKLYGPIPESFGSLTKLSDLDLCDNQLKGLVPSSFGQITSLRNLNLCNNCLNGPIPSELCNLSSLQYLNMRINSLSGGIPNELWSISSLIMLDLSNNQLGCQLPTGPSNLQAMDLSNNQLGCQLSTGPSNLQAIYLMNNNFSGEFMGIGKLRKLQIFNIQGNNFSGKFPESISTLRDLQVLVLMGNNFQGPFPSVFSKKLSELAVTDLTGGEKSYLFPEIKNLTLLRSLTLRNCSLIGPISGFIWSLRYLSYLDLSFNSLSGGIPAGVDIPLKKLFLRRNELSGTLPEWVYNSSHKYVDVSENFFTSITPPTRTKRSPNLNLFACCSNKSPVDALNMKRREADYCANNKLSYDHLYINCGGNATWINGSYYEADLQPDGGSTFVLSDNKAWAYSSMGTFLSAEDNHYQYIIYKSCNISMADAPLYTGARVSPISLKYYGFCLRNNMYTVRLHFAEIGWEATTDSSMKRNRVFDVEIQGNKVLRDFNIEEAVGLNKDITREFTVSVNETGLEIHLYWSGKGSTTFPTKYYGPLISAISVSPVRKHTLSSGIIATIAGSSLIFFILIIILLRMIGWFGGKRSEHDGVELYPGGVYNFQQIMAATNNFHNKSKIGRGTVYKGVLPKGVEIAVKQLSLKSKQEALDIIKEIGTVYAIQHQNLARPLGCCSEKNRVLLVYKYMENISLEHALFGLEEHKSRLNWQTRVKICLGMAKGLAFLHEESKLDIIHGNIKPSNILLDKDFTVKISDFGYSQFHDAQSNEQEAQSNEQEIICGSIPKAKITGHMAPEYIQGLPLTPKVDVYSFGIVTLEILSGQKVKTDRSKQENIYLLNTAYKYKDQKNLIALLDSRLRNDYKTSEANRILDLAMECVSPSFDLRPTMSHAVEVLEGKIKIKSSANARLPSRDSKMAESIATLSQSTQSGSFSLEGSSTTISLSTSKEIDDDSIISAN